jgi:hypothetical protein
MRILEAETVPLHAPSLMSEPLIVQYYVDVPRRLLPNGGLPLAERVQALLAYDNIPVQRWRKKGPRQVNLRPGIARLEALPALGETVTLAMLLHEAEDAKAKPQEVVQALLGLEAEQLCVLRVYKHEAFVSQEARLVPLLQSRPLPAQAREVYV